VKRRFAERLENYDLADARSKLEYNRRLFAVVAGRYDAVTTVLSFGRDRTWKRYLVASLPEAGVHEALDIACGTGDLTFAVAERYPHAHVTGIDLAAEMLARARRNARRWAAGLVAARPAQDPAHSGSVRFEMGNMSDLPYEDGRFDLVTAGYAFRNAPDLPAALRSAFRVLRPAGTLAILDFSHADQSASASLQIGLLRIWGRLWGKLLHDNPEVYGYIAESLRRFPSRRALEGQLRGVGFRRVRSRTFFLGLIAVTFARK
jgi:demethylmenaquinone methyltransferase/2-methoxy-6-polyprenyl-1,4-benzoquinol methylase